jgi:hypothetical protein
VGYAGVATFNGVPGKPKECAPATLQQSANRSTYLWVFKGAALIRNHRQSTFSLPSRRGDDNLIGVCVDHEIGIMRHDYYLSPFPGISEMRDQLVEDGFRIEILLGLVDYNIRA